MNDPHPGGGEQLRTYALRWVDTRRVGGRPLAPKTQELYGILLRVHILPRFGDAPLSAIRTEEIRLWQAGFDSPITAAKCYRLIRAILTTAVEDERLSTNPCRVKGAGIERSAERPIVGPDVVLGLAQAIDPRFGCLVLLAGFGGLRLGELLALRRRHVDLVGGSVVVAEQVITLSGGRRLVTEPKSRAGRRTVSLPTVVVDAVRGHLARRVGSDSDALLFPNADGGLLATSSLYAAWRRARVACGYDELHIHDLRHAAGTLAAWTGATQRELMARLGHSSPATAMRYQHASADRDRMIALGLDTLIAGALGTGAADEPDVAGSASNQSSADTPRGGEEPIDPRAGGGITR
jgi:integrase